MRRAAAVGTAGDTAGEPFSNKKKGEVKQDLKVFHVHVLKICLNRLVCLQYSRPSFSASKQQIRHKGIERHNKVCCHGRLLVEAWQVTVPGMEEEQHRPRKGSL